MDMGITIHVTDAERTRIETLARERGIGVDELVRRLVIDFVQEEAADSDVEDIDYEAEFRQSWKDALAGKGIPIDEVWTALDDE